MDEYQIPERANKVERETAEQHCSFCQGQMARAALDAARPSACQAVTCTQHAAAITSACLYSSGQSELCVLFDLFSRLCPLFNLLPGLRESLSGGQAESRVVYMDLTSACLRVLEGNCTGCPGC